MAIFGSHWTPFFSAVLMVTRQPFFLMRSSWARAYHIHILSEIRHELGGVFIRNSCSSWIFYIADTRDSSLIQFWHLKAFDTLGPRCNISPHTRRRPALYTLCQLIKRISAHYGLRYINPTNIRATCLQFTNPMIFFFFNGHLLFERVGTLQTKRHNA